MLLSTLWIFTLMNYIYADIMILSFKPGVYQQATAKMNTGMILMFCILMEIPIAMILLSRIFEQRMNRIANIIAGLLSTAFVAFTLIGGKPSIYYLFFCIIEIATTVFITWYALKWRLNRV